MAKKEKEVSAKELLNLLRSIRKRPHAVSRVRPEVNDNTRTQKPNIKALELYAKGRLKTKLVQEQILLKKREEYRKYLSALAIANNKFDTSMLMSDEQIDRAMEQNNNRQYIDNANPVWSYPAETRQALGYYTNEERELAARFNDMRSSTFFGNVMPNFGRQAAYNNPSGEMGAFRETALYVPNTAIIGSGFGLPSATLATVNGLRAGWQTAGNVAQKATQAVSLAVKSAAPVVGNSRWAFTTAGLTTPAVAQAADGDYTGLGFGLGVPLTIGGIYLFRKYRKAPKVDTSVTTQYKPKYGLFSWEHPDTWAKRLQSNILDNKWNTAIREWNEVAGDATKEREFIDRYKIREVEGTPQYIEKLVTEPVTTWSPKTEIVKEPVMEEVIDESTGLATTRPKLDAEGKPITRDVEVEVKDNNGLTVFYDKPVLDAEGKPIVNTRTVSEPKIGEDGQLVYVHNPITSDGVPDFLRHRNYDGNYTSNIDIRNIIFEKPTRSLRNWALTRNAGRLFTYGTVPTLGGLTIYKASSKRKKRYDDDEEKSESNYGLNNPLPEEKDDTSSLVIPIVTYNPQTKEVIGKTEEGRDTVLTIEELYDSGRHK